MKSTLDLRPVHCRREDRIRTHILLCWLALLLIRIIEHETNDTWRNIRNELQRLHLGTFTSPAGTCQQRTELTTRQRELLRTLALPEPARFTCLDPPRPSRPPEPPAPPRDTPTRHTGTGRDTRLDSAKHHVLTTKPPFPSRAQHHQLRNPGSRRGPEIPASPGAGSPPRVSGIGRGYAATAGRRPLAGTSPRGSPRPRPRLQRLARPRAECVTRARWMVSRPRPARGRAHPGPTARCRARARSDDPRRRLRRGR